MFDVESLSGHSRGHAKEFAEPAAELSEVAAGGAGKKSWVWQVGCGNRANPGPQSGFPGKHRYMFWFASSDWANADASIAAERLRRGPGFFAMSI